MKPTILVGLDVLFAALIVVGLGLVYWPLALVAAGLIGLYVTRNEG